MGIYSIKPKFQQTLTPLTNFLVRRRANPDVLTALAFILSLAASFAFYFADLNPAALLIAPPLLLTRLTLNALDGLISRELRLANKWGEVKNELSDRLSDVIIFLSLSLANYTTLWLGTITTIFILLASLVGILSKAIGLKREYSGVMGKADRMIYLSLFSVFVFLYGDLSLFDYFLWLVIIGTIVTIIQRLTNLYAHLKST